MFLLFTLSLKRFPCTGLCTWHSRVHTKPIRKAQLPFLVLLFIPSVETRSWYLTIKISTFPLMSAEASPHRPELSTASCQEGKRASGVTFDWFIRCTVSQWMKTKSRSLAPSSWRPQTSWERAKAATPWSSYDPPTYLVVWGKRKKEKTSELRAPKAALSLRRVNWQSQSAAQARTEFQLRIETAKNVTRIKNV